jgi:hypothetical protein
VSDKHRTVSFPLTPIRLGAKRLTSLGGASTIITEVFLVLLASLASAGLGNNPTTRRVFIQPGSISAGWDRCQESQESGTIGMRQF